VACRPPHRTAPLMEVMKARLTTMLDQLFSQSKLAEAIKYTLGLTLFLRDVGLRVDSNTVERSMRPIAMTDSLSDRFLL
jgi:transposase